MASFYSVTNGNDYSIILHCTLLENLTDDANGSMWLNVRPFPSIWLKFLSHTVKSAKSMLTVYCLVFTGYQLHMPYCYAIYCTLLATLTTGCSTVLSSSGYATNLLGLTHTEERYKHKRRQRSSLLLWVQNSFPHQLFSTIGLLKE